MIPVMRASGDPETITLRVEQQADERRVYLVNTCWPMTTVFTAEVLEQRTEHIVFRYPYVTVRAANGHATYRVSTCEQGRWEAHLVEGFVGA